MNRALDPRQTSGRSDLFTRIGAGLLMPIVIVVALTDVAVGRSYKPIDADQYCSSVHLIDFKRMKRLDGDLDPSTCHQAVAAYNQRIPKLNALVAQKGHGEETSRFWMSGTIELARSLLESLPGMQFDSASFVIAWGNTIESNQGIGIDLIDLFESGRLPYIGTACASATSRHPLAERLKLQSRYGQKPDWSAIRNDLLRTGFECKESDKCVSERSHYAFLEGKMALLFGASISVTPAPPPIRNSIEPMCRYMLCGDLTGLSKSILESDDNSDVCVSVFVSHL